MDDGKCHIWIPKNRGCNTVFGICHLWQTNLQNICKEQISANTFLPPVKGNKTKSTLGIRVIPPTSKTSPMSLLLISASRRHFLHGSTVRCTRSATRDSNLARVSFMAKCFGPLASTVIYGKLMSVYRIKTEVHLGHCPFVILLYFSLQLSKQSSDHKLLKIQLLYLSVPLIYQSHVSYKYLDAGHLHVHTRISIPLSLLILLASPTPTSTVQAIGIAALHFPTLLMITIIIYGNLYMYYH